MHRTTKSSQDIPIDTWPQGDFHQQYRRLLEATRTVSQAEFASALKITQPSVAAAKKREQIPAEWLISLFQTYRVSPDYIRFGRTPMYLPKEVQLFSPDVTFEGATVEQLFCSILAKHIPHGLIQTAIQGMVIHKLTLADMVGKILPRILPGDLADVIRVHLNRGLHEEFPSSQMGHPRRLRADSAVEDKRSKNLMTAQQNFLLYPLVPDQFDPQYLRILALIEGATQRELAEFLGVRQAAISDAKKRRNVPAEWLLKLFDRKRVNPDYIRFGLEPRYLKEGEPIPLPIRSLDNIPTEQLFAAMLAKYLPENLSKEMTRTLFFNEQLLLRAIARHLPRMLPGDLTKEITSILKKRIQREKM